jgi:hypothetical protein
VHLIGKPGCHLCDDARVVVERVTRELGESFVERNILEDADLHERYWERIPVVLVDGVVTDYWRVDAGRLREALGATQAP